DGTVQYASSAQRCRLRRRGEHGVGKGEDIGDENAGDGKATEGIERKPAFSFDDRAGRLFR
ncbi:MAG: hypothetical protein V2A79_03275, partial [Planctomycetota bacterium]